MKKRILLTGGLGYLGGRVAQALLASGRYELRIAGRRMPDQMSMPEWLRQQEVILLDLAEPKDLDKCCNSVDMVLHLAAMNEIDCGKHPDAALLVNGYGTHLLAEAAERAGVSRFVYVSTAHVYAAPLTGFIDEETLPRPKHPYAISKRVGEDFLLARKSMHGLVVRLSNAFGCPVQPDINRWGLVVNDLCCQAAVEKKVVLKSNGLQQRDFISFEDTVAALFHLLEEPADKLNFPIYNIGSGKALSVRQIANLVTDRCEAVLGYRPQLIIPEADGEMPEAELHYDVSRLQANGWQPKGDVTIEIDALLRYCREQFAKAGGKRV